MSRRRDNDKLKEAVTLVEDTSFLDEKHTFYRNGRTGHLHGSRRCWKIKYGPDSVYLTVRDAMQKRICTVGCIDQVIPSRDAIRRATELVRADRALSVAEYWLEKADYDSVGTAITSIASVQRELELLDSEGIYPEYRKRVERAEALARTAAQACVTNSERTLREISTDVNVVYSGQRWLAPTEELTPQHGGVLGCTPEIADRGGTLTRRVNSVQGAFEKWRETRISGTAETAEHDAKLVLDDIELNSLEQLVGVHLDSPNGEALPAVTHAWRQQVESDLMELLQLWEGSYRRNIQATDLVLIGVDLKRQWYQDSGETAVLRSFEYHETPKTLVGIYPEVVLHWLYGQSSRKEVLQHVPNVTFDSDLLQTVATLWNPTGSPGDCYTRLEQAVAAAAAL